MYKYVCMHVYTYECRLLVGLQLWLVMGFWDRTLHIYDPPPVAESIAIRTYPSLRVLLCRRDP